MNKLFYPAVGLYAILLLIFGLTTSSLGFFVLILLLATGLIISISKINEITKSKNTLKAKVYFSFIFSLLIFSLITFFWTLGKNPLLDEFGMSSIITTIVAVIGLVISFLSGIILSIKRKEFSDYDYTLKSITLFSTISIIVILILSFYNPLVSAISRASQSEDLCYLTLAVSDNSFLFNSGYKNRCLVEVARQKLDVSICKKVSVADTQTGCYIAVASAKNDPSICRKGADEGIPGMDSCLRIMTEKTGTISAEDLVSAVEICESTNNCNIFDNMEIVIFGILNNPADPELIDAIKATKYLGGEGQRERAIPLLRNLLTTAPLEGRKASLDSLLNIIGTLDFEAGKQELSQILPLIENQSNLSNYTEQVKQRLSAELLPAQIQSPTISQ
jgi:hypothetical protein